MKNIFMSLVLGLFIVSSMLLLISNPVDGDLSFISLVLVVTVLSGAILYKNTNEN